MSFDTQETVINFFSFFVPLLFALSFHEYAHAWAAYKLGDNTAQMLGRLSLNPLVHADVVGTFALPVMLFFTGVPFLFGWAKPVPVNGRNLKSPVQDMFWIALAGPLANVLLAIMGAVGMVVFVKSNPGFNVLSETAWGNPFFKLLNAFFIINIVLAVFNMIPVHPLDGGKVLARFLPYRANYWLERNQMVLSMLLLVVILLGGLGVVVRPIYTTWVNFLISL